MLVGCCFFLQEFQNLKLNIKRHATEDDLSSDEWHLYTQFIAW